MVDGPITRGISRDEWLKALSDAGVQTASDPDALTIAEYMELMGLNRSAAGSHMKALVAAGKAIKTMKRGPRADGKIAHMVAYRLVK